MADHCLRSRNYINLVVSGKDMEWQWLDIEAAVSHCIAGAGIWDWASNDAGDPDVVMACAGDVPTLETLAAVTLLRDYVPDIRIRVVNVVDLMTLQPQSEHPHGLDDQDFDELFTTDRPVIFAYHGYPPIIHKLTYRRRNHDNIHVRGYKEEGTTTTPFDMVVLNHLDRYQLALDAIRRIPRLAGQVEAATARYWTAMERHKLCISEHGEDMPEVRDWRWTWPGGPCLPSCARGDVAPRSRALASADRHAPPRQYAAGNTCLRPPPAIGAGWATIAGHPAPRRHGGQN